MKKQEEAAFRNFVVTRYAALLRTAYLLTGDRHHAEDLVQTALTSTALAWTSVTASDDMDAYTFRILINCHRRRFRRPRLPECLTDAPPEQSRGDPTTAIAERSEVLAALSTLPPNQRAVLLLRFWEDMTESQVARTLGCSVGTVRSHAARALAKLRTSPLLVECAGERGAP